MPEYRVEREVLVRRTEYYSVEADSFEEAADYYFDGALYDYEDWDEEGGDLNVYCSDCNETESYCGCSAEDDSGFFASLGLDVSV